MAQYFWRPSVLDLGRPPTDISFEVPWRSFSRIEVVASGETVRLELETTASQRSAFVITRIDGESVRGLTDVEVYMEALWAGAATGSGALLLRTSGEGGTETGYAPAWLQRSQNDHRIVKYLAGGNATLATESKPVNFVRLGHRARMLGDRLQSKTWALSEGEPEEYSLNVTDGDITGGGVGILKFGRNSSFPYASFYGFGIGTNGDPAPTEPIDNTIIWTPSLFMAGVVAAIPTGGGGTTITAEPASLSHATALAASAVSLEHLLAPAALTHASALSESAVQLGTQVVPAALSHASAIAVAEVQTGLLIAPESLAHATTLSDGALALVYSVAPNALTHTTGLGDGAVFSGVSVEPAAITYSTSLGAGAVQFVHEVQPASLSHLTSLGASAINVGYEIAPANLTFGTLLAPVLVSVSGSGTGASAAEIAQAVWGDPRALTVGKFLALK